MARIYWLRSFEDERIYGVNILGFSIWKMQMVAPKLGVMFVPWHLRIYGVLWGLGLGYNMGFGAWNFPIKVPKLPEMSEFDRMKYMNEGPFQIGDP